MINANLAKENFHGISSTFHDEHLGEDKGSNCTAKADDEEHHHETCPSKEGHITMDPLVLSIAACGDAGPIQFKARYHNKQLLSVLTAHIKGAIIPHSLNGVVTVGVAGVACDKVAFDGHSLMPFTQRHHSILDVFRRWNQT